MDEINMQQDAYQFIEEIKNLLSSKMWDNILLNCTKNEIYIFWLLFRRHEANMTEIAEYIHVPLNTATGVIARMEKNEFVTRGRSKEDKRVVTVQLSEKGTEQVKMLVSQLTDYTMQIVNSFSTDEMELLYRIFDKVKLVLKQEKKKEEEQEKEQSKFRKIIIE